MSKKYPSGILAVFSYLDDLTNAMEKIHDRGDFDNHEVFSPTSYHEIEHAGNFGSSAVPRISLAVSEAPGSGMICISIVHVHPHAATTISVELRGLGRWEPGCYTRTTLHQSDGFVALLLCWSPGVMSPVVRSAPTE